MERAKPEAGGEVVGLGDALGEDTDGHLRRDRDMAEQSVPSDPPGLRSILDALLGVPGRGYLGQKVAGGDPVREEQLEKHNGSG